MRKHSCTHSCTHLARFSVHFSAAFLQLLVRFCVRFSAALLAFLYALRTHSCTHSCTLYRTDSCMLCVYAFWPNSSSAGAGTIFATGILRGASFQTRIGARPGSRTGSLFIQPPGIPGSAGFSRTQVFSKSTSLGTSLATCTFQSEVGLETGGQGRAGGRTAQMTTRGLSDGHAGHLSRDDLSSTRRRSLGRKLSFSAHDFFGYLLRACTHNPTLANVDSKKASLGVVSGRHGDCATWSFRA